MYKTEKQVLVDIQTPKPRISKYSYKTIGSGTNERTNIHYDKCMRNFWNHAWS